MTTYQIDVWTALGDPTRRTIFTRLASRPCAVGELASSLPVSRPAVSQHLKILKEAGLVEDRHAGTRRIYRVNPEGLRSLRAELDLFWSGTLSAYRDTVDRLNREDT
ncbi:metalloregulator ArsR/SmtB family transcription factor [soil metagenome]